MTLAPQPRLQGLRERAAVLVVVGFVLLLPPFLLTVDHRTSAFGAPLFYVYIFVVWGGLILLNGLLARRLDSAARAAEAAAEAAELADQMAAATRESPPAAPDDGGR